MSDRGPPSDPFGRSERTIIRPNPAGRRPESPASSPQRGVSAFNPATPGSDDWVSSTDPAQPFGSLTGRNQAINLHREQLIAPNQSPVMRAATPLLVLLGRVRIQFLRAPARQLMEQVAEAIQSFERDVRAAGLSADQARTATYVLCATADDIVQNIPSEDRHVWTQYSMLSRFFGELLGGVRFFEEVDKAKADPLANYQLLELQHACLALGFEGIHRTSAGGASALQHTQRSIYETLRRVKSANPELSPRWQGQALPQKTVGAQIPIWAIGSFFGVLLLGVYLFLRFLLQGESDAVAQSLIGVHPAGEIGIQRRVFSGPPPPPPPTPQITRVRSALGPPLEVTGTGTFIVIRMSNLPLFEPASATVSDKYRPLLDKIAAVLEKEPGTIKIVGHTDSAPIRSPRFPSNYQLSLERAKAVAEIINEKLSKPDRIGVEGKGPDVPIASNNTAEGRASNRRVEVLLQRTN